MMDKIKLAGIGLDCLKEAVLSELEEWARTVNELRWTLYPDHKPQPPYPHHYLVMHVLHQCAQEGRARRINNLRWGLTWDEREKRAS